MSKSLKNRIIARLDDTIAYFDYLPKQSGIAAGYNKRGVRYFTIIEAIISISGAIDSVKEGRRARKRIIVRPSRYHKGVHELYTYHFPKAWSEACLNNRETIKLAQRLAHDLEHDPVAARPMRLKYLMQFYAPVSASSSASASSASASASSASASSNGSTPKIYKHFYQFAYVTILRSLYAAQAAANASTWAATPSVACAANDSADECTLSIAPEYYSGIALCAPPSHPVLAPSGCPVLAPSGFPMLAPSGCPVLATFGSESVPPSSSSARSISCASIPLCASYRRSRHRAA